MNFTQPLSFEPLFLPLVLDARDRLLRRIAFSEFKRLSPEVLAGWEKYLLKRLSDAASKAAYWRFQIFETVRAAFPIPQDASRRRTGLYEEFVENDPASRLEEIFRGFPALGPLCEVLCANWVDTVAEFFGHLEADRAALERYFVADRPLGQATKAEAGLSDSHAGGRCVVRVFFENGTNLIYKPRSLAPEVHFAALIAQINSQETPHRFRVAQVWNHGDHGWMEDICFSPCSMLAEVRAFYWRMGALLGLVHLAQGVDFHQENLVAAGEFPVLIDLETLWHPQELSELQAHPASTSVLRTGILPSGHLKIGAVYHWSALALTEATTGSGQQQPNLHGEDALWPRNARDTIARHYLVTLGGVFQPASDFTDEVVSGFRWLGELLLGNQDMQEKFIRWLGVLIRCPRRLVPRSTGKYQSLLEQLTTPCYLRREQVSLKELPAWNKAPWPEMPGEQQALEQLDVPRFEQNISACTEVLLVAPSHWSIENYLDQIPVIVNSLTPR